MCYKKIKIDTLLPYSTERANEKCPAQSLLSKFRNTVFPKKSFINRYLLAKLPPGEVKKMTPLEFYTGDSFKKDIVPIESAEHENMGERDIIYTLPDSTFKYAHTALKSCSDCNLYLILLEVVRPTETDSVYRYEMYEMAHRITTNPEVISVDVSEHFKGVFERGKKKIWDSILCFTAPVAQIQ